MQKKPTDYQFGNEVGTVKRRMLIIAIRLPKVQQESAKSNLLPANR